MLYVILSPNSHLRVSIYAGFEASAADDDDFDYIRFRPYILLGKKVFLSLLPRKIKRVSCCLPVDTIIVPQREGFFNRLVLAADSKSGGFGCVAFLF